MIHLRIIGIFLCCIVINQASYTQENTPDYIKVMTFNILHGRTMKGDFNLDVIADVIKRADPDLVALQEVDYKTNRAKGYDLASELGIRTGMASIFGRAMPYDGGEYGEAVLSKYSFISTRNMPLPYSEGNEPRAALEGTVLLPSGDTLSFIGTHLDHLQDDTDRLSQAKKINELFANNVYPTILAGDLNDTPKSRTIQSLDTHWLRTDSKETSTFPSDHPIKKIDYILLSRSHNWAIKHTEVIQDTIASDHCAYFVILQLFSKS